MTDLLIKLIPVFPLLAVIANGLFGRYLWSHEWAHRLAWGSVGASFICTIAVFFDVLRTGTPHEVIAYQWIFGGDLTINLAYLVDPLTCVMLLVITGVGFLIHVYSVGYMHGEDGFTRFFTYMNLFMVSMLLLVMGNNYAVLFIGWEGVGLCSYLLIGYYYDKISAAKAASKAFVVNRIGDAGFLLAIFLVFINFKSLDYTKVFAQVSQLSPEMATAIALCLLVGAVGKSAQIPLYTWLPDAMEGPTPVSALIHAATMVTAGVYLVARMSPLYLVAPGASEVVAVVGAATAFFAATVAVAQNDIKKVLAYSTVSQLGFMFVAAGVGAYGVAIFHVYTHAFFKACLFLGAGSVIHALSGEQDIRKMGGLWRKIPWTFATFAIATAAIAGIPPLAGFWSKDEILWFAFGSSRGGSSVLWIVMAATALMTAFYMFRLLWLTFLGRSRMDHEVEHHVHESPWSMVGVLVVLAVLSAVGGFFDVPHFLSSLPTLPEPREGAHELEMPLLWISIAIALAGFVIAMRFFGRDAIRAAQVAPRFAGLQRILANKYFVDEAYERLLGRPLTWVSERVFLNVGDRMLLDGTLNGLARLAHRAAGGLGRVQTGNLHLYALFVLAGALAALVWGLRHV